MSEIDGTRTICIPSLAFNYVNNRLESIGCQGELYTRERGTHVAHYGTRWHELFGTPEKAARTLETVAENLFSRAWSDDNATLSDVMCSLTAHCKECPARGLPGRGVSRNCGKVDYDALIEWLRGDA